MSAGAMGFSERVRVYPPRGRRWKNTLLLGVFALIVLSPLALGDLATVETIRAHRAELLALVREHYTLMLVLCTLGYALAAVLSLPLGVVLSVAMGFLFGRWTGSAVVIVGGTAGSVAAFTGARYLFADAVRAKMGPRLLRLARGFQRDAFSFMLFTRLVPFFPFWFINLVPAFSPVATRTFVASTVLGIAPGAFVFANLGQSLGRISSPEELRRPGSILSLALLGVLALIPVVWRKMKTRKTGALP